jgi:hypothetical protein
MILRSINKAANTNNDNPNNQTKKETILTSLKLCLNTVLKIQKIRSSNKIEAEAPLEMKL